jgi:lipopolysaccharide export system permease protein
MSTISSYILRQTMGPLLAAVAIALLVLLTERMLRLLDLVLDTGGGLRVLLQMLAFLVPHYMALALPAAFFLGVLLAFNRLHQNRELDALGSAGVGLRRLISPVLLLALGLAAISAANFAVGQPYARYIYRALVYEAAETAANVYLQERTFMEVKGVTFMAERIRRNSQEFDGIFIYEERADGKAVTMTARHGNLEVAPRGEKSTLFLVDGVRLESAPPAAGGESRSSGVLEFSQFQIPIELVGQEGFRPRGEDERELTLVELWRDRAAPPPGVSSEEMVGEFHDRIVRSISVLFLPFLAIPFALGPRRASQLYGIAAGLVVLVAYNQVLAIGSSMSSIGRLPPLIAQWLPLTLLAVGSVYLFYRSAFRVPGSGGSLWSLAGPLESLARALRGAAPKRQHPE